jgi:hypothetical protein
MFDMSDVHSDYQRGVSMAVWKMERAVMSVVCAAVELSSDEPVVSVRSVRQPVGCKFN